MGWGNTVEAGDGSGVPVSAGATVAPALSAAYCNQGTPSPPRQPRRACARRWAPTPPSTSPSRSPSMSALGTAPPTAHASLQPTTQRARCVRNAPAASWACSRWAQGRPLPSAAAAGTPQHLHACHAQSAHVWDALCPRCRPRRSRPCLHRAAGVRLRGGLWRRRLLQGHAGARVRPAGQPVCRALRAAVLQPAKADGSAERAAASAGECWGRPRHTVLPTLWLQALPAAVSVAPYGPAPPRRHLPGPHVMHSVQSLVRLPYPLRLLLQTPCCPATWSW